jgi:hypothetical protein
MIRDEKFLDVYVYINYRKVVIVRAILSGPVFFFSPGNVTHHFRQRIFQPCTLGRYACGRCVTRVDFRDRTLFFLITTPIIKARIEVCARWFRRIRFRGI